MSDSTQIQSYQNDDQSIDETTTVTDKPSDDLGKRLQNTALEAKKFRQKNSELQAKLDALEQERLAEQGKFKELAETEKKRADALKKALEVEKKSRIVEKGSAQFEAILSKSSCIDAELIMTRIDVEEYIDKETGEFDRDSAQAKVEELMKAKPHCFQKQAPGHRDLPPKNDKTLNGKVAEFKTPQDFAAALAAHMTGKKGA